MDDKNIKNRRLKDKLKLDFESYNNLIGMLNGDDEDKVVALQCINNVNQKESLIYTLFLRKNGIANYKLWTSYCPKVLAFHSSLGILNKDNIIKYSDVFEIIKTQDNKEENLDFFLKDFTKFLKSSLGKAFEFIDDIDITMKIKKKHE